MRILPVLALMFAAVPRVQEAHVELEHFGSGRSANEALLAGRKAGVLRVSLGVGRFGPGDPAREAALAGDLLRAAELDAVALGAGDLDLAGRLSERNALPLLCANVRRSDGEPAAKTHIVRTVGATRVVFIGVTRPPAYARSKPDLKGWIVEDPAAVLRKLLPQVAANADLVVLLAVMDRLECAKLVRAVPGVHVALVPAVGTNDPEPLILDARALVQSPVGAGAIGRLKVTVKSGKLGPVTNAFESVSPEPERAAAYRDLRAKHGMKDDPEGLIIASEGEVGGAWGPLKALAPGDRGFLGIAAGNRAVEATFHTLRAQRSFGGRTAREGAVWAVLDSEWTNIIPMEYVFRTQTPVGYRLKNLDEPLQLVVDGRRVIRFDGDLAKRPGGLIEKPFHLPRLGSTRRGNLVFEVPRDASMLDLRLYDYAHGHLVVPLLRKRELPAAAPIAPFRKHETMEAGVYGLRRAKELNGRPAAEGLTHALVDFRARSLYTMEVDATAFDPKAEPGTKIRSGSVTNWGDFHRSVQLVVDGEYGYALRPESELSDNPRFLPDLMTGGVLVFRIPEKVRSIELRAQTAGARLPDGTVVHPKPLRFVLEGKVPTLPEPKAIARMDDGGLLFLVTGRAVLPELSGVRAADGKKFLALDLTVTNRGKGNYVQTRKQFKYACEDGTQLALHPLSFTHPRYPAELVWVPQGERRSFRIVYEIPVRDARYRLMIGGYTKAETVSITGDPAAAPKIAACPKCRRKPQPDDKFCQGCGTKLKP